MAEFFDKDGNPVQGYTKEELDIELAKLKPAIEDLKYNDEIPAWAKELKQTIESLGSTVKTIDTNQKKTTINSITNGLDADKKKEVEQRFETLAGAYGDSPEDQARRAEDAYLLAVGQKYTANEVNMGNLSRVGGKVEVNDVQVKEVDKNIQAALGVTAEDVAKFGKK